MWAPVLVRLYDGCVCFTRISGFADAALSKELEILRSDKVLLAKAVKAQHEKLQVLRKAYFGQFTATDANYCF